MAILKFSATLLLSFSAIACADSPPDSSGTSASRVADWEAEVEARIGSLDDPDQWLTPVSQVVIGPEERIYIAQPMDGSIRLYDSRGTLVSAVGRRGEGPGEFGVLGQIGFVGDTLYVLDTGLGRVNFFSADGEFLSSRSWTPGYLRGSGVVYAPSVPLGFVLLSDGTSLVKPGMSVQGEPNVGPLRIPFLRIGQPSNVIDTIAWEELAAPSVELTKLGTVFRIPAPFHNHPLSEMMPDGSGVVIVDRAAAPDLDQSSFRVTSLGSSGDTLFSKLFRFTPVPMSNDEVRRAIESVSVSPQDQENPPSRSEIERALRRQGLIPAALMPVTGFAVGQDGKIWLRRENEPGDSILWNILDREGRPLGALRLPATHSVVAARGNVMAALELDALDVPYVVRYRIGRQQARD